MINLITFPILGLLIGSFLNVCIYRIPRHEEIVVTPSHCMACGHELKWYELIPVFSYIGLGGKCRNCKIKLSIQYPMIELLNGAAYLGLYVYYGVSAELFIYAALFSALMVVFMIDLKTLTIPNSLVIVITVIGLSRMITDLNQWLNYVIGFFVVSVILLLIAIITRGKMGGGDIKLMAAAGLVLGWQNIILALVIGAFLGAIIGLSLIGFKVVERKQMIPFGPYLAAGIMISAIFGDIIWLWYLELVL